MELLTERALSPSEKNNLKKNGINKISDSIDNIGKDKSLLVDSRSIEYINDSDYVKSFINLCHQFDNYDKKVVYIAVSKWYREYIDKLENTKGPIGAILRYMKSSPVDFKKEFSGYVFIFYNSAGENFALYPEEYKGSEYNTVIRLIGVLTTSHSISMLTGKDSQKVAVKNVKSDKQIEEERKERVKEKKEELVAAVAQAVEDSDTEEEAIDNLDNEYIASIIEDLDEEDDGRPKFDAVRTSRIAKLNDEFLKKTVRGKTVKDIIDGNDDQDVSKSIPPAHLKVASINKEDWDNVKFVNFNKAYDIKADILKCLYSLSEKSYPVSVVDINVEDTSTDQDLIDTYTVTLEDGFGKRSTIVFDIPKFKNNRFMRLRGNEKVLSGQLLLLPCLKTDEDTVQCVSNYKKIFIYRQGSKGKSLSASNRLIRALKKMPSNPNIKVVTGDNSAICSKYELPVDYIDIASEFTRIETKTKIYYFNQDEYYTKFNANSQNGLPYAIYKADSSVCYYNGDDGNSISYIIADELIKYDSNFESLYNSIKASNTLNYSSAKILNTKIPLIVMLGYSLGLTKVMKKCIGDVFLVDNKKKIKLDKQDYIKFKDGYLAYDANYSNSLLFNGLSICNTESYSIEDVDRRIMWLDFLDEIGDRILCDGLDNFADLFIDPITKEVCDHIKIPSNYFDMLIYANNLLADNKYNKHTDISGNRYRSNEIVAGYFYTCLAKSYEEYKAQVKRGRKVGMSMKRSAVIDAIFADPMSSDLSILNPLLEIEAANSISFKGLSGMNSDRSYSLDKRTYDDSMMNKVALSTGFAANVGINRQTTIDMDIEGKRGYIKQSGEDDMSITKSFAMTEAVTPFGTTRDDPFRSAMTFIQTSKHAMRTKKSAPLLITNGADEAMAYISSDTFSYKAKEDGIVKEIVPDSHMIVEYKNPIEPDDGPSYTNEYIDLKEEVKKNSDGGFYITLKLDTDLKVGSKFSKGDIIAYDRTSYSNKVGESDDLAYNLGVLAKVAIMNTDEGFEDSTSVSEWLSEAMATEVVVEKDKDLSKNTNVYSIVKVGQPIQEGDPLIIFQNSFDEEDANILLKNITDPEMVSDLGRIKLKSKYTGVVQDIKIYRTCEIDEMSDSLKAIVTEYELGIKRRKKLYEKYKMPGENLLDPDYKMEPSGIMKNNKDGVKIVFYIKYNDKLSIGDKTVAQSANKGVVKNIFPEGLEPFSEYRPTESIHALYAARSFNARMVTSVWTSGAINKCMVELDRQVKDIMGIIPKKIEDIE